MYGVFPRCVCVFAFKIGLDILSSARLGNTDSCSLALYIMDDIQADSYSVVRISSGINFPVFAPGLTVLASVGGESELRVLVRPVTPVTSIYFAIRVSDVFSSEFAQDERNTFLDISTARVIYSSSDGQPILSVGLSEGGAVRVVSKARCPRCRYMVRVPNHLLHCLVFSQLLAVHDMAVHQRRLAWLGDALHAYDVRVVLLNRGGDVARLQSAAQSYVSNEHLAETYDVMLSRGALPACTTLGPSVKQRATAFEASYVDSFRDRYLIFEFGLSLAQVSTIAESIVCTQLSS